MVWTIPKGATGQGEGGERWQVGLGLQKGELQADRSIRTEGHAAQLHGQPDQVPRLRALCPCLSDLLSDERSFTEDRFREILNMNFYDNLSHMFLIR